MKAKKAVKRLNKIEALLSDVMNQFSGDKQALGELLNPAKAAVLRAKETLASQISTSAVKNPTVGTDNAHPVHPVADGSKSTSLAAKKSAPVKRKTASTAAKRPLKKTA